MGWGALQGIGDALTSAGKSVDTYGDKRRRVAQEALQRELMQSQLATSTQARDLALKESARADTAEQRAAYQDEAKAFENTYANLPGDTATDEETAKRLRLHPEFAPFLYQTQKLSTYPMNLQDLRAPGAADGDVTQTIQGVGPETGDFTASSGGTWMMKPYMNAALKRQLEQNQGQFDRQKLDLEARERELAERARNNDLVNSAALARVEASRYAAELEGQLRNAGATVNSMDRFRRDYQRAFEDAAKEVENDVTGLKYGSLADKQKAIRMLTYQRLGDLNQYMTDFPPKALVPTPVPGPGPAPGPAPVAAPFQTGDGRFRPVPTGAGAGLSSGNGPFGTKTVPFATRAPGAQAPAVTQSPGRKFTLQ